MALSGGRSLRSLDFCVVILFIREDSIRCPEAPEKKLLERSSNGKTIVVVLRRDVSSGLALAAALPSASAGPSLGEPRPGRGRGAGRAGCGRGGGAARGTTRR